MQNLVIGAVALLGLAVSGLSAPTYERDIFAGADRHELFQPMAVESVQLESYLLAKEASASDVLPKEDLDLEAMPKAIIFINEEERPAEEGPLSYYEAIHLADKLYPDVDHTVYVEGADGDDYEYVLARWKEEYGPQLPPYTGDTEVVQTILDQVPLKH